MTVSQTLSSQFSARGELAYDKPDSEKEGVCPAQLLEIHLKRIH